MRKSTSAVLVLGAFAVVAIAAVAMLGYAAPTGTAAQSQYAPRNTAKPTISGTAQVGSTLTANPGTWESDSPVVFTYQWQRCNRGGQACVAIPGATSQTYVVQPADEGNTLRVEVTARNSTGANSATSDQTAVVAPAGSSIPVTAVNPPDRLVIDSVQFTPNPVRSRQAAIDVRVKVEDTRGRAVSGAEVFIRTTPVVTTTPPERTTNNDGFVSFRIFPERDFPQLDPSYNVQVFARAQKPGDPELAGVSTRRLVQFALARR